MAASLIAPLRDAWWGFVLYMPCSHKAASCTKDRTSHQIFNSSHGQKHSCLPACPTAVGSQAQSRPGPKHPHHMHWSATCVTHYNKYQWAWSQARWRTRADAELRLNDTASFHPAECHSLILCACVCVCVVLFPLWIAGELSSTKGLIVLVWTPPTVCWGGCWGCCT